MGIGRPRLAALAFRFFQTFSTSLNAPRQVKICDPGQAVHFQTDTKGQEVPVDFHGLVGTEADFDVCRGVRQVLPATGAA